MPTLNWIGKDAVINHHNDVPFRVLERKYTWNADGSSAQQHASRVHSTNKIIHGDNLEALKALLPEYEGRIKCIYIDPPYNTGNENWVYNDNVNSPKIRKWLGQVVGKESEDLSRHDKWLCMMYPRLVLLQKLLSDDGAIFISIDDNEQANLKLICDEIFGAGNFITQIAWKRKKEISNDSKNVAIQGEYILCYGKSSITQLLFEGLSKEYIDKSYKEPCAEFPLDYWRPVPLTVSKGLSGGGYNYSIKTPNGKIHNRLWAYPQYRYEELLQKNKIYFGKDGNGVPQRVMYLSESQGKPVSNYWDETSTNKEGKKEILSIFNDENIFSTPKPTQLINRILQIASDKDSIILDSFAGSGTTAHAVLNLNKADGGNRKFILVEMEDYAETITAERIKRVINGYGDHEGTGGCFEFCELGEPVFNDDGYLNENIGTEKLREYIWYTETRTPLPADTADTAAVETRLIASLQPKNYLLGNLNGTAYYFYYEPDQITTLSHETLSIVIKQAETYVIYADQCVIDGDWLAKHNIIFKKIPRDIRKF